MDYRTNIIFFYWTQLRPIFSYTNLTSGIGPVCKDVSSWEIVQDWDYIDFAYAWYFSQVFASLISVWGGLRNNFSCFLDSESGRWWLCFLLQTLGFIIFIFSCCSSSFTWFLLLYIFHIFFYFLLFLLIKFVVEIILEFF